MGDVARGLVCVAVGLVAGGASPSDVRAYDFEVSARTEAYAYQLRRYDQDGLAFLNRRRITQYLGLRIYNILDPGQRAYGADGRAPAMLYVRGLVRFFSDFGDYAEGGSQVQELRNNRFELLVGSLEGRNLFGFLDFSLGRQYELELFDIFAYDGLRIRLAAPAKIYVQGHAGVQVNRNRPFGMAVFEPDGSAGDDDDAWAPTFGAALGIDDPDRFSLRLAYRAVTSRAALQGDDGEVGDDTWALDVEILAANAQFVVPVLKTRISAALRYNLLTAAYDELSASVAQPIYDGHRLVLEALRSRPHFDGDSIFNVFALEAFHELAGRYSLRILPSWLVEARAGYRWFWQDQQEDDDPGSLSLALSSVWRWGRFSGSADAFWLDGRAGRRFGGDVFARWVSPRFFFGRRVGFEGRVSVVRFEQGEGGDGQNVAAPITTLGLQAGALVNFLPGVRLHLTVEDNISRLYKSALRVLALVDLELAP